VGIYNIISTRDHIPFKEDKEESVGVLRILAVDKNVTQILEGGDRHGIFSLAIRMPNSCLSFADSRQHPFL
jgi:hypothetical protein